MKIVLVDNLLLKRDIESEEVTLQPQLGLISLISVLRNSGHEATLYDPKIDIHYGKLKISKTLHLQIFIYNRPKAAKNIKLQSQRLRRAESYTWKKVD